MARFFATLAAFVSTSALAAGTCDEFRLDRAGGSMEHVAVRDQDQNGTCYAVSIAQLYDALRFASGKDRNYEHQTSGLYVANTYREAGSKSVIRRVQFHGIHSVNSGMTFDFPAILQRLAENGSCSETQIRAKLGLAEGDAEANRKLIAASESSFIARFIGKEIAPNEVLSTEREREFNSVYSRFTATVKEAKKDIARARSAQGMADYDQAAQKLPHLDGYGKLYQDRRNSAFKALSLERLNAAMPPTGNELRIFSDLLHAEFRQTRAKDSPEDFPRTVQYLDSISQRHADAIFRDFGEFLNASKLLTCSEAERVKSPEIQAALTRLIAYGRESPGKIGRLFARNGRKLPVIATVDCFPFQDVSRARLRAAAFRNRKLTEKECGGGHAFIVMGRRKDPSGRCEYLVRNSWGTNAEYPKEWYQETANGVIGIDADLLEAMSDYALSVGVETTAAKAATTKPSRRPARSRGK